MIDTGVDIDTADAVLNAVLAKPTDFTRYFIMGDVFDDMGFPRVSEFWRLLGEHRMYPRRIRTKLGASSYQLFYAWRNGSGSSIYAGAIYKKRNIIPDVWYLKMKRKKIPMRYTTAWYDTRCEAYVAASNAFRLLTDKEIAQCRETLRPYKELP